MEYIGGFFTMLTILIICIFGAYVKFMPYVIIPQIIEKNKTLFEKAINAGNKKDAVEYGRLYYAYKRAFEIGKYNVFIKDEALQNKFALSLLTLQDEYALSNDLKSISNN